MGIFFLLLLLLFILLLPQIPKRIWSSPATVTPAHGAFQKVTT